MNAEREKLFRGLDALDSAYELIECGRVRESIHLAREETKRELGALIFREEREARRADPVPEQPRMEPKS